MEKLLEAESLLKYVNEDDYLLLSVLPEKIYNNFHIPGSINIPADKLFSPKSDASGALPLDSDLQQLLKNIGISDSKKTILYDCEGGMLAGRLAWILELYDLNNWQYLNGGLNYWLAKGFPISKTPQEAASSDRQYLRNKNIVFEKEDIHQILNNIEFVIWDSRSEQEFSKGHIPTAVNLEHLELFSNKTYKLNDLNKIEIKLKNIKITKDKNIIVYCRSHYRSGIAYLILRILGYNNVFAYPGSWQQWSYANDMPIEYK